MSTSILGDNKFSVESIKPPNGVALPVKFVLAPDIVTGILHLLHEVNTTEHSFADFGLTRISAKPFGMFDQSEVYELIKS